MPSRMAGPNVRAVDTNVIVRVLIDDPDEPGQTGAARELVRQERTVLVPDLVLIEMTWVLRTSYRFSRAMVAKAVQGLIAHGKLVLESEAQAAAALKLYESSQADYADCWILAAMRERGVELVTFDKKLARLEGTLQLE